MTCVRCLATIAVSALLVLAPAAGAQQRVDRDLEAVLGEFVVSFDPSLSGAERDKAVTDMGGKVVSKIAALNAYAIEFGDLKAKRIRSANAAKLRELREDERFSSAEANVVYRANDTPNDPSFGEQYAWGKISAPAAWDVTRGSSLTTIAVIGTGVQRSHPDLDAKILPGYDWVQNDTAPDDGHGHSTHVAGTAAAETNNGIGGAGMCPGCRIMPLRVLDNSGSGSLADVANAITYAVDYGARVINLSLGGPGSTTLQQAVDYAVSRGAFLACAAGNDNTSSTTNAYPGAYPGCFAVAASTSSDVRSSFSNYGSWVEAAAPGSSIYSTWLNSGYNTISGTSMATPHVAGLAGLLASSGSSTAQIKERICTTSDKIAGTGSLWTCGRINARAAVGGDRPPPPPPPGTNAMANGGFESGIAPWSQTSTGGYALITTTRSHAGAYSASLGGYNNGTDSIAQSVTVPSNGTLKYWWYMTTQESGSTVYDRLQVRVLNSAGTLIATPRVWSNASGPGLWRQDSLAMGAYAGQQLTIEFRATTDFSLPSSYFVDDVSLHG
jgi:subtilisin family serine protease